MLICDDLNTNKPASISVSSVSIARYACRLLNRLEMHYTPKHEGWHNIAEIELSFLLSKCLNRRIPEFEML